MYALILLLAFLSGLIFRSLGFPPLLGYLVTGFAAHTLGIGSAESIEPFAELGITLLLFTIGLKLNLTKLAAPQVWAVAGIHMVVVLILTMPFILLVVTWLETFNIANQEGFWTLAFALSFSSTVFAVKMFDTRGENTSYHATIAIGILIIQDLVAVAYLVVTSDKSPNLYTALLLLLPLARPLLLATLQRVGHGELLLLFGVGAAIGGFELFELLNLKGGLGALVFGLLLGGTAKSQELYKNLIQLKDLFLIGFFLLIGYFGLPSAEIWIMAGLLCLVLPLRPLIYYALLVTFRLRSRTAFFAGMSLFNYSEFGLIVAAIATEAGTMQAEWLTTLALAMALSFFIATPVNTRIHKLYRRHFLWTERFEREDRLPIERFPDLGRSEIAVLGMGRVGLGAYTFLKENYSDSIVGIEENYEKAKLHQANGINCDHGNASDQAFWMLSGLNRCNKIFVCLSNHRENLNVVDLARESGFRGILAVVSRFPDEERELQELGCITFNLYAQAGHGFAEHVMHQIEQPAKV